MQLDRFQFIRGGIWLYFILLVLEGALRKWFLPEYSDIIFVIRDPLVIGIYFLAFISDVFPRRPAMAIVWLLAICSLAFSFSGDAPLLVTIFGLRTNYLHLPLIFVMASVLDRNDVIRYGRWFIILSVPIAILMVVQFNSEKDALVNVGAGGAVSAQLPGAMGRIRPPGPFSFIGGVVNYFSFVMAFVFYGWLQRKAYHRLLPLIGTAMLIVAIPVSISRALSLALLLVAFFAGAVAFHDRGRLPWYIGSLAASLGLGILAIDTIYVQAFFMRWIEAEAVGGSFYGAIVARIFEEFTQPFVIGAEAPLFGHGIGLGTIAGARLSTGVYGFLLAESELARIVLELGPILGFGFIAWRAWLGGLLVIRSWREFTSGGDALAWLLSGASILTVMIGQWGGATTLGFAIFGAGLSLAACNAPAADEDEEEDEAEGESEAQADDNETATA